MNTIKYSPLLFIYQQGISRKAFKRVGRGSERRNEYDNVLIMPLNYELDRNRMEVLFCGGCRQQYSPDRLSSFYCTMCKKQLVSWYTKDENEAYAIQKWKNIN